MRKTWVRFGRVVIVLAVAVVLYALLLPSTHGDPSRIANLSIRDPHVAVLKSAPSSAKSVGVSKSTVKLLKTYAAKEPAETGVFETEWTGAGTTDNDGGLLLQVVPTVADAAKVLIASRTAFAAPPASQGAVSHFTVQGIPGQGNAYVIPASSSTAQTGYVFTMVFMVGRVVAVELVELSKSGSTPIAAQTIAREELALLQSRLPSFSMVTTTRPALGVILVIVGAVVIGAAAFFGPEWVVRRRISREVHAQQRARSQYRSRGRRAVRRYQDPTWRQHKRR